jgi:hypothetical protein
LKDEIGSIAKIVTDSFGRGQISAVDHTSMSFNCQSELPSILTPLVGHVLDGVYVSKEVEFDALAPFNDAEAIKVINGIVKTGDIPKGTKPSQFTSAADNYGYALGIMKKDGTKQRPLPILARPQRRGAGFEGTPPTRRLCAACG